MTGSAEARGRLFPSPPPPNSRENLENREPQAVHVNLRPPTRLSPPARLAPPVARPGKGARLPECIAAVEEALAADGPGFIAFTVMWRRLLALADDREIAREQAELVHRLRRVLARRGWRNAIIFSVLERTERHGLHGHVMAQAPCVAEHKELLDTVEAGLRKRFGRLPGRTFNRDGRRRRWQPQPLGSIWTRKQALGALRYRLKSLPQQAEEHGVRRGVGLRPVECISLKVSRGRCRAA
jgi:hypothetical protein